MTTHHMALEASDAEMADDPTHRPAAGLARKMTGTARGQ